MIPSRIAPLHSLPLGEQHAPGWTHTQGEYSSEPGHRRSPRLSLPSDPPLPRTRRESPAQPLSALTRASARIACCTARRPGDGSAEHLPILIYFIDETAKVQAILPELLAVVTDGLVEAHPTEILKVLTGKGCSPDGTSLRPPPRAAPHPASGHHPRANASFTAAGLRFLLAYRNAASETH
jgi:hypothetical protein